jgi:GT2 family glycosyltransferase
MYNFNILEHPICFSSPRRTVPFSCWRQHIPFAMLLVDILKPRTLVEIGVHYGDSYCAFCQAVAELQLRTTCYGVDTWNDDPQASFDGSEVLVDLKSHHDPLYGSFSNIIQGTFDEAMRHFPDGAIDVLHIDGYHTYEAVKHEFDAWLPKISPSGVILLHDINEKKGDFGVWKLWDELKAKYLHFEFLHGHGLGLIAVGEKPPEELNWLFGADDQATRAIQDFFFLLGNRLNDKTHPEPDNALTAIPFSGASGDWLGARIKLENLRVAQSELDAIRGSAYFQLAWKLRSFVNTMLPLGIRRIAERILIKARTWFARRRKQSLQEPSDKRTELARKYLRGTGLAIGSFTPNLIASSNITIDFVDAQNYEGLSKLDASGTRWQTAGEDAHRVRLEKINDEAYDFVICDKLPDNLTDAIEAFQLWLRVIKPGGILYLATPESSDLSKRVSDLQSEGMEIRILDSAEKLDGDNKEQIYIIEKVNYISKVVDMLQRNPNLNAEYIIDVVVPIYNAYEDLEKCIYSLFKHQDIYRVTLVNDRSTDERIKELLNTLREYQCERFEVVENKNNIGYLKTANIGMRMTRNDVILLNSDTMVTSGWAKKIRMCAYSRHCIATVTPFSNNGVECSIPEPGQSNEIPEGFTIETFAELVENCSVNRYPELVTAVGFCMYIRRSVIEEIGYLDEGNFGLGYGEENDFSMRAARKGYKNILCDNTFVFHKGGSSFSHKRNALIQKSAIILDEMYPDFWPAMHLFWRSKPLKELHNNIKKEMGLRGRTRNFV